MRSLCYCIILLLTSILLSSCGFQLQGSNNLPPELQTLYLTTTGQVTDFSRMVKENLMDRGITLVPDPAMAKYQLQINNTSITLSQDNVATSSQTRNYSVSYTASFTIATSKGIPLTSFSLSSSLSQTMLAGQLVANNSQLEQSKSTLQEQVINQLFFKLGAKDTLQSIKISANGNSSSTTPSTH